MDILRKAARQSVVLSRAAIAVAFRYVNHMLAFMLIGLRPLLGPTHCYYPESCGNYTTRMLKEKSLISALWYSAKRILSCNPLLPLFKLKIYTK